MPQKHSMRPKNISLTGEREMCRDRIGVCTDRSQYMRQHCTAISSRVSSVMPTPLQLPRFAFLHQTFLLERAGILNDAKPFFSDPTVSAKAGNKDCRELQAHVCRPAQTGHSLPPLMPLFGVAIQRRDWPLGQHKQIWCTCLLLPRVVMLGWKPFASLCSLPLSQLCRLSFSQCGL